MLNFILSRRLAAAAALALSSLAFASTAQARSDVTFSIGIHVPGVQVHSAPVYVPPPRHHARPQPVYVQPGPVYVQPRPIFVQPRPIVIRNHPVFVQPPAYGHYYGNTNHWDRGDWKRAKKHKHRGHGGKHGGHRH